MLAVVISAVGAAWVLSTSATTSTLTPCDGELWQLSLPEGPYRLSMDSVVRSDIRYDGLLDAPKEAGVDATHHRKPPNRLLVYGIAA